MKKFFKLIILILFIIFGYLFINRLTTKEDEFKILKNTENIEASITNYYVYGTHFNIEGTLEINDNISLENMALILKNDDEEYELEAEFTKENNQITFKTSKLINTGINLDKLPLGNWYLLIKVIDGEIEKYYTLSNNTEFDNIEYYTITKNKKNNKIDIVFDKTNIDDKNINYVSVDVKESKLPDDVYDITIDAGHGGIDPGSSSKLNGKTYNEADFTLDITLKLKKELEKKGYKVLLTRDSDVDLDYYDEDGRATLPNKYHTKLCLSLHLNSEVNTMTYGGVEVYVPNDSDYTLARLIASNVANETGIGYSKKKFNKVEDGIYFNSFSKSDIEESAKEYQDKGLKAYDIEVGAPQMYMIREVGGIMTHAYVDGRNEKYGLNPYYNSNQTAEGYLVELAYISYEPDLKKLVKDSTLFADGLKEAIIKYLE